MTPKTGTDLTAALAPVRRHLRAEAEADAARIRAEAAEQAAAIMAAARTEARKLRVAARAAGTAEATAALAAGRATARRRARTQVQAARREAYEELRRAALRAVAGLTAEPTYPRTREGLAAAALATLGPDARVTDVAGGGVAAETGGRRLDYSLARIAEPAIEAVAAELLEAIR